MLGVMRVLSIVLALGLLAGCVTDPSHDEVVLRSHRPGVTRAALHAELGDAEPFTSVSRPANGWSCTEADDHGASRVACLYEQEHPGKVVASCEVYWVGRATSVPMTAGGVWWDYLLFDSDDKLLGYHRRFLD